MINVMVKMAVCAMFLMSVGCTSQRSATAKMHLVDTTGIGPAVGAVHAQDTDAGLELTVRVRRIPGGAVGHGFHVHQNPSCGPVGASGATGAALAAGGHYDPGHIGMHLGPHEHGHLGDLPLLQADKNGDIRATVFAPRLKVKDLKNRTLVIHAGGDNYNDSPQALGGGGARIACGVWL